MHFPCRTCGHLVLELNLAQPLARFKLHKVDEVISLGGDTTVLGLGLLSLPTLLVTGKGRKGGATALEPYLCERVARKVRSCLGWSWGMSKLARSELMR